MGDVGADCAACLKDRAGERQLNLNGGTRLVQRALDDDVTCNDAAVQVAQSRPKCARVRRCAGRGSTISKRYRWLAAHGHD